MSTKPSSVPLWDTNGTNVTPVTAGHKADGYGTNEVPTSDEFNAHFKLVGEWLQYINDGDVALNNVTIAGAVDMTGAIVQKILSADTNALDINAGNTRVRECGLAPTNVYTISGILNGVPGRELWLVNQGGINFRLKQDALQNANMILIPDRAQTPPGLSGTDILVVPPQGAVLLRYEPGYGGHPTGFWRVAATHGCLAQTKLVIHAALAQQDSLATPPMIFNGHSWECNGSSALGHLVYPLNLPVGAIIAGWKWYGYKSSDNTKSITAALVEIPLPPTPVAIGATHSNSVNSPGAITLPTSPASLTRLPYKTIGGKSYAVTVSCSAAPAGFDFYYAVELDVFLPV